MVNSLLSFLVKHAQYWKISFEAKLRNCRDYSCFIACKSPTDNLLLNEQIKWFQSTPGG